MPKPLLSIGIIFKNEIRCLERCLKSLQPLRDAIPCELVMADTGADDGSREVAEKYADILIDFPWINDFAAARNAVMDRCTGKWYLSIDSDEWLDENITELVNQLSRKDQKAPAMALIVRNYDTYDLSRSYTDFVASRILSMSTDMRYEGAIHERWNFKGDISMVFLESTVLHHDGYVYSDPQKMIEKAERNMKLLRVELEEHPDNLITRMQYIESGRNEPNYSEVLLGTLKLIDEKSEKWDMVGPPVYRYAVEYGCDESRPELEEWVNRAEELFPDTLFFRIDIQYLMFCHAFKEKDIPEAIRHGEAYLKAIANRGGKKNVTAQMYSVVKYVAPFWQQHVKVLLAAAYAEEEKPAHVPPLLKNLDYTLLEDGQLTNLVKVLRTLQTKSDINTIPLIRAIWNGINLPEPTPERMEQRKTLFISSCAQFFTPDYREAETDVQRPAYTLLTPLEGECGLGRAAVVLSLEDGPALEKKLSEVDDWTSFPIHVLAHALRCGVRFPTEGMAMNLEEMDALAKRLSGDPKALIPLAVQIAQRDFEGSLSRLTFARGLVLAAVQSCSWVEMKASISSGEGVMELPVLDTVDDQYYPLARAFARVEEEFIQASFSSEVLREESVFVLPSMHRFGWYCAQAFRALDSGDMTAYVRLLGKGLDVCHDMKAMVDYLLDHTPEVQEVRQTEVSEELRALADQIREILSAYAPDDPAVALLKQSEAYQKVAYLIEGSAVPVQGGRVQ